MMKIYASQQRLEGNKAKNEDVCSIRVIGTSFFKNNTPLVLFSIVMNEYDEVKGKIARIWLAFPSLQGKT